LSTFIPINQLTMFSPQAAAMHVPMVLNVNDLQGLNSGDFLEGSITYVKSTGFYYKLAQADTTVPDGITWLAAKAGGNWIK
jgi:hypothetical protein